MVQALRAGHASHCASGRLGLGVAVAWFFYYVLVSRSVSPPVRTCVEELQRRPATTFALGILVLILTPLVFLLLTFTGVGLLVIPFIMAALVLAAIVGKVGFLEWLGLSIGRPFRASALENPQVALLVGSILLALLLHGSPLGLLLLLVTASGGSGRRWSCVRRDAPGVASSRCGAAPHRQCDGCGGLRRSLR